MEADQRGADLAVGFIMGVTYRKIASLLQHRLKEYDITPEQWSVLNQIDQSEGLIQKEIADRCGKDKPTTTRILDLLESKGLIYKQTGKQDRRSFAVFSTERGRALIRETIALEQGVTEEVKRCMSEEEYLMLLNLLERVNAHISRQLEHNQIESGRNQR
ncbi:MAG: MarR family transcriptional regulator [Paenibacillus macerans]|uniref:IclR helix-turn-helix domain protein n=1 Tax=Paenibacillus macerans TaxID=44252 RepID=A0A090ZYF1_PAEMA|nr:MarR family transcriptional regulator [Paenibacillus macerans]KFN09101.1 iclR helix-turn-helix domain protein [Paenibacillus macerans]MCY7560771.1 MarR family transcriptional regulator [Paenibacillus macerans]MDU7477365.1 MarR family transcriptional regulator [Paenibacillus macerans]MEC0137460.1 MarR family transcriptional regulator [Paenibacillus macerans]MEC0154827.1 MarR family transcriptional regulator [Paenibacillus macerans]